MNDNISYTDLSPSFLSTIIFLCYFSLKIWIARHQLFYAREYKLLLSHEPTMLLKSRQRQKTKEHFSGPPKPNKRTTISPKLVKFWEHHKISFVKVHDTEFPRKITKSIKAWILITRDVIVIIMFSTEKWLIHIPN